MSAPKKPWRSPAVRTTRVPPVWLMLALLSSETTQAQYSQHRLRLQPNFARSAPAGNPCGLSNGNGGPCDAGFPGVQGFVLGSFGWGPECSGWTPVAGESSMQFASRYSHTGNTTFVAGVMYDNSMTCCRSNGRCSEHWGNDPVTGNNISEGLAAKTYAASGDGYGVLTEVVPITNYLHDSRDVCIGWTGTGPACSSNQYEGPFGYYLGGPTGKAMGKLTVAADGGPQQWCQTVDAGSGQFAFSCFLRADTIGAARLSLTGVGNSTGNHTCTVAAMSDAGTGRREGCISVYSGYTAANTQIKACVTAGAADNVSGTFGMSDCQLERDPQALGRVTMYLPSLDAGGSTVSRNGIVFDVGHPSLTEVSGDAGCLLVGRSERVYDWASIDPVDGLVTGYGVWASQATGTNKILYTDGTMATMSYDGTHTLKSSNPGVVTQGDGGQWYMEVEWDDSQMCQWDGGSALCSAVSGKLWNDTARLEIGNLAGASNNSLGGQFGPIIWGNGSYCRAAPTVTNRNGHLLYIIGDGWSGGGSDYNVHTQPLWSDYVQSVVSADPWGVQASNQWYGDGGCCYDFPSRKVKFGSGNHDQEVIWLGGNDVGNGAGGAQLFADALYYVQREARKFDPTGHVYWFNLAPQEMPDDGGNIQTQVNAFNTGFRNVCADGGFAGYSSYMRPEPGYTCIDVNALLDPTNSGFTTPAYRNGAGYLTAAGAQAVGNLFLQSWP